MKITDCLTYSALSKGHYQWQLSPDVETCRQIAKRLDLIRLHDFTAKINFHKINDKKFHISARVHAEITQICVRSLEEFSHPLDAQIDLDFVYREPQASEEVLLEGPEYFSDDHICLGELLIQEFSLAIPMNPILEKMKQG